MKRKSVLYRILAWMLTVVAMFLPAARCLAAAGAMDKTFGDNGMFVLSRPPTPSEVETRQIVPLANGRILALGGLGGGPTGATGWQSSISYALTEQGKLDTSFADVGRLPYGGAAPHRFVGSMELANGSIVLASEAPSCASPSQCAARDSGPTYRVERVLATGALDTAYGVDGAFETPSHLGNAAILSDASLISLGASYSSIVGGPSRPYTFDAVVADSSGRPNADLASMFLAQMIRCSPTGSAQTAPSMAPVVRRSADERILFAYGSCMLRLNRDGTPDTSFGTGGVSQIDNAGLPIAQVLVLDDGSTLTFSVLADGSSYRVVKRLRSGAADASFGAAGVVASMALPFAPIQPRDQPIDNNTNEPNSRGLPALDADGRVLVAGSLTDSNTGVQASYLARFDSNLKLDTTYGSSGTGLARLGDPSIGIFIPFSAAIDNMDRVVLGGQMKVPAPLLFDVRYAEAVVRLQADSDVAPGSPGGGCDITRNAQVDPTLWLLVILALGALTVRAFANRRIAFGSCVSRVRSRGRRRSLQGT